MFKLETFITADYKGGGKGFAAVLKEIEDFPKTAKTVMARAMNDSMAKTRTEVVKGITDTYFVKKADVLPAMHLRKAHPSHLEAILKASGSGLPLYDFKVSPTVPASQMQRKVGVRVQVRRDSSCELTRYFIARMGTGHIGVFRKAGRAKRKPASNKLGWTWLPIKEVMSVSVSSMMKEVMLANGNEMMERAHERFQVELERQLDLLLAGK